MSLSIDKLNPFSNVSAYQGITAASASSGNAISGGSSSNSQSKMFSSQTEGVNTNIGVGDSQYIAAQVGKVPGVGRTLGFA